MRGAEPTPKRHVTAPPVASAPAPASANGRLGRGRIVNGARPGTTIPRVHRTTGGRKRPGTVVGQARKPCNTSAFTPSHSRPRASVSARVDGVTLKVKLDEARAGPGPCPVEPTGLPGHRGPREPKGPCLCRSPSGPFPASTGWHLPSRHPSGGARLPRGGWPPRSACGHGAASPGPPSSRTTAALAPNDTLEEGTWEPGWDPEPPPWGPHPPRSSL